MLADTRWLNRLSGAPLRDTLILTTVAAIGLPGMQAANLISTRTDTAERLISENQTLRAWRVVDGLTQLGSQRRIRDTRPETLLTALHQQVLLHGQAAAVTLPEDATPAARVEQARHLFALEMLDDALAALGDLPEGNVEAALLAANIAAQQRRWPESIHWSQWSLALLEEQDSRDPAALEQRLASYLTLADSLRSDKRYRQAEELLHTALERLPEASAELHFQLGRHYELGGNPRRAVEHLETAIKLNPVYAKNAGAMINMIRNDTPLCMFEPYRPVAR
jgi:tetratricopeptide (TPR) repeat protein